MPNFYAVKQGRKPGIYNTWAECQEQIKGFSGAVYKKFASYDEAEQFCKINTAKGSSTEKDTDEKNIEKYNNLEHMKVLENEVLYAYVDGSFNEREKIAGYGLVLVQNDKVIFKDLGAYRSMEMNESKNVFGEIRGALKAVELAIANDFNEITIVYDYMGIECWATDQWKANKVLTQDYKEFMQKYMKFIDIKFKKVKAHSGEDKYNDMADLLAKKAVGIL